MSYTGSLKVGTEPYPGYCLIRRLGSGGFGEVWEAQVAKRRNVALKFLPCDASHSAVREIRSLQEIRQLRHPHLIRIDRIWCFREYIVVAMELADGSLLDLLEISRSQFGRSIGREQLPSFGPGCSGARLSECTPTSDPRPLRVGAALRRQAEQPFALRRNAQAGRLRAFLLDDLQPRGANSRRHARLLRSGDISRSTE